MNMQEDTHQGGGGGGDGYYKPMKEYRMVMDDSGLNEIEKKAQHLKEQEYTFNERIANSLERIAEALQIIANEK